MFWTINSLKKKAMALGAETFTMEIEDGKARFFVNGILYGKPRSFSSLDFKYSLKGWIKHAKKSISLGYEVGVEND